jgi:hypothetical protein
MPASFILMNNSNRPGISCQVGRFPEDVDDNIFVPDALGLRRDDFTVEDVKTGPICPHLKHLPSDHICAYR